MKRLIFVMIGFLVVGMLYGVEFVGVGENLSQGAIEEDNGDNTIESNQCQHWYRYFIDEDCDGICDSVERRMLGNQYRYRHRIHHGERVCMEMACLKECLCPRHGAPHAPGGCGIPEGVNPRE